MKHLTILCCALCSMIALSSCSSVPYHSNSNSVVSVTGGYRKTGIEQTWPVTSWIWKTNPDNPINLLVTPVSAVIDIVPFGWRKYVKIEPPTVDIPIRFVCNGKPITTFPGEGTCLSGICRTKADTNGIFHFDRTLDPGPLSLVMPKWDKETFEETGQLVYEYKLKYDFLWNFFCDPEGLCEVIQDGKLVTDNTVEIAKILHYDLEKEKAYRQKLVDEQENQRERINQQNKECPLLFAEMESFNNPSTKYSLILKGGTGLVAEEARRMADKWNTYGCNEWLRYH